MLLQIFRNKINAMGLPGKSSGSRVPVSTALLLASKRGRTSLLFLLGFGYRRALISSSWQAYGQTKNMQKTYTKRSRDMGA